VLSIVWSEVNCSISNRYEGTVERNSTYITRTSVGCVSMHPKICLKNIRNSGKIKPFCFTAVRTEHFQFIAICVNGLSSNFNKTYAL